MAKQFGVPLGGTLVKLFDSTVLARLLAQPCDDSAASSPGGETRQRHRPPDPSARNGIVLMVHRGLLPFSGVVK
ncbi:hypothetical protein [Mycolicibacterium poriferae]|uniref:hypothetical protein n=1 Tax=Mycolicibacterium poriferae TaxID=39694 RepID=UPI0032190704